MANGEKASPYGPPYSVLAAHVWTSPESAGNLVAGTPGKQIFVHCVQGILNTDLGNATSYIIASVGDIVLEARTAVQTVTFCSVPDVLLGVGSPLNWTPSSDNLSGNITVYGKVI